MKNLVVMPARRYGVPSGRVGCRIAHALAAKLTGVWQRRWNVEKFIVFKTVILQRTRHVTKSCKIRRRMDR